MMMMTPLDAGAEVWSPTRRPPHSHTTQRARTHTNANFKSSYFCGCPSKSGQQCVFVQRGAPEEEDNFRIQYRTRAVRRAVPKTRSPTTTIPRASSPKVSPKVPPSSSRRVTRDVARMRARGHPSGIIVLILFIRRRQQESKFSSSSP